MGVESGRTSLEAFQEQLADKYSQWKAMFAITDGFGDAASYPAKAAEQQRERERIENEVVELAAESLAVLGFDPVMENIYRVMGSAYVHYHDKTRLLSKILRYVTEKKLIAGSQSVGEQGLAVTGTRDSVQAALKEASPRQERPRHFADGIEFGKSLSAREAIDILLAFHSDSTEDDILKAFPRLRDFTGMVVFERDSQNGQFCVSMNGYDGDRYRWGKNIYASTGQPIPYVG